MDWEEHYILEDYPDDIKLLIGLITLRYGQTDRLICYALENECGSEKRKELIGIFRNGIFTLGRWIEWAEKQKVKMTLGLRDEWLDELITRLKDLKKKREGIFHDALLQDKAGNYVWMSGAKSEIRGHRKFSFYELNEIIKALNDFGTFIEKSIATS